MAGGENPLPHMVEGVRFLERAGAQLIAIPCNTAHLWYDQITAATRLPVLHIIEAVIDDLRRLGLPKGRIGLMGTAATLKLGLYQRHLEAQGYECLVPDEDEVERYCMGSIRAVKGNQLEQAYSPAAECIARLKARGADAVVLGCTELPLAVPHALRPGLGITLTDSIDALARAAIDRYLPTRRTPASRPEPPSLPRIPDKKAHLAVRPLAGNWSAAQVGFADLVIDQQIGTRVLQHHAAVLQHIATVGHLQRLVGVLLDQEHRHALLADLADDVEDLRDHQRRQAQRGLIQQQQARTGHQRAADGQHLLLAAGHQAGALAGALLQPGNRP